jgi:hypothetical protein
LEHATRKAIQRDAEGCKGLFASGRYPKPEGVGAVRLRTGCSGIEKPIQVDYTVAPRPNGGFYVFSLMTEEKDAQAIQSAGAKVYDAALKNFGQR